MAATDIITYDDCKVDISADGGANWVPISDYTASVTVEGGERDVAEAHVFGVDAPRTAVGKMASCRVTIRVAYTEGASEPFAVIEDALVDKEPLMVRFSPLGGAVGEMCWTSDTDCYVTDCPPPQGDADSGEIVFCEATFYTQALTGAAVPEP
jgi:hypothetical protein